jgi:hypothetical protein
VANLSDSLVTVASAIEAIFVNQKNQGLLPIRDVWYGGDNTLIPETPAILIEPDIKTRDIEGSSHMNYIRFRVYLTIFHSKLGDPAMTRKDCDSLAEQVEGILHANRTLGGLVVHGMVESLQPGRATNNNVIMKATRLLWVGMSRSRL